MSGTAEGPAQGALPAELVVVATATARPGMGGALEEALREADAPTRAMPGCLGFTLYRRSADPDTITAIEHWASPEDHERHLQSDHVRALMGRFETLLSGVPDIVALRPLP